MHIVIETHKHVHDMFMSCHARLHHLINSLMQLSIGVHEHVLECFFDIHVKK